MGLKSIFKWRKKKPQSENREPVDSFDLPNVDGDGDGDGDGGGDADSVVTKDTLHEIVVWINNIVSGNILLKSEVTRHYPYVGFLLVLGLLYITYTNSVQGQYRQRSRLTNEVKDLRAKSLTIATYRMQITRQSNIVKMLEEKGSKLQESLTPNVVIE